MEIDEKAVKCTHVESILDITPEVVARRRGGRSKRNVGGGEQGEGNRTKRDVERYLKDDEFTSCQKIKILGDEDSFQLQRWMGVCPSKERDVRMY